MTGAVVVDPSDRLSTRVLRVLMAAPEPMTARAVVDALALTGADAKRVPAMLKNHANRGRAVVTGRIAHLQGRPALYAISDGARASLERGITKGWRAPRTRYWNNGLTPRQRARRVTGTMFGPKGPRARTARGSIPHGSPLWKAAAAAVPRHYRLNREDLISELVLAMLEGETDLHEALRRAKARDRDHLFRTASLDAPVGEEGGLTWIETITDDRERA